MDTETEQGNKFFEADYTDHLFTVQIKVYHNGISFSIIDKKADYEVVYQTLIGALEITKIRFINAQSDVNKQSYNKEQSVEVSDTTKADSSNAAKYKKNNLCG